MLYRSLDVIFQHLGRLVVVPVLIPLAIVSSAALLDHTQLVTARLWADQPSFQTDNQVAGNPWESPAERQSHLFIELLRTDSFIAQLRAVHRGDPAIDGEQVRRDLQVFPDGSHGVVLIYLTGDKAQGVKVLNEIITEYGKAVQAIQFGQAEQAHTVLQSELDQAKKDMDTAVQQTQQYVNDHHLDKSRILNDPVYNSLASAAQSKTSRYLLLLDQADHLKSVAASIPQLQASLFHLVDPPAARRRPLSQSPAIRYALYALGAVVALELGFVYVVARRDPRIRSALEVSGILGMRSLGIVRAFRAG